jgi:hypothetical protein
MALCIVLQMSDSNAAIKMGVHTVSRHEHALIVRALHSDAHGMHASNVLERTPQDQLRCGGDSIVVAAVGA